MGVLIVFEGIDGCGKGTQIEKVAQYLGDRAVIFKQPGATKFGNAMRRMLFEEVTTHEMDSDACSLLYLASHLQGIRDVVQPALAAGKIVLCDRWDAYSGVAFGRCGLNPPVSPWITDLRQRLAEKLIPDLTFLFHGKPQVFLDRAKARTAETHEAGKRWANVEMLEQIQLEYYRFIFPSTSLSLRTDVIDADSTFNHVKFWVDDCLKKKGLND